MVTSLKSPPQSSQYASSNATVPSFQGGLTGEPSELSFDYDFYQAFAGDLKSLIKSPSKVEKPGFKHLAELNLDKDWVETESKPEDSRAFTRKFESEELSERTITLYFSGEKVSEPSARIFNLLLKIRDHTLAPFEFEGLHEVMRNKNIEDSFVLQFAQTKTIDGRKVLIVEGKNTEQNHKVISLYIDAESDGSKVQEIHFQCPMNDVTGVKTAKTIFDTITWNEKNWT